MSRISGAAGLLRCHTMTQCHSIIRHNDESMAKRTKGDVGAARSSSPSHSTQATDSPLGRLLAAK